MATKLLVRYTGLLLKQTFRMNPNCCSIVLKARSQFYIGCISTETKRFMSCNKCKSKSLTLAL